ncbi:MAG: KH domain-containing protein [Chloroflexota bacterium]|jgi:uncharacterized protein
MKELLEFIVKGLVDNPDAVEVHEIESGSRVTLELAVASDDMGRVIGRRGRVINAVRALVQVKAARLGKMVDIELLEE